MTTNMYTYLSVMSRAHTDLSSSRTDTAVSVCEGLGCCGSLGLGLTAAHIETHAREDFNPLNEL